MHIISLQRTTIYLLVLYASFNFYLYSCLLHFLVWMFLCMFVDTHSMLFSFCMHLYSIVISFRSVRMHRISLQRTTIYLLVFCPSFNSFLELCLLHFLVWMFLCMFVDGHSILVSSYIYLSYRCFFPFCSNA
jgi:hypothetical protein